MTSMMALVRHHRLEKSVFSLHIFELLLLFQILISVESLASSSLSRRSFLGTSLTGGCTLLLQGATEVSASAAPDNDLPVDNFSAKTFRTLSYGQAEYTNSITASRDTNISPKEAYDVIRQQIPLNTNDSARALDLGAGAGLSTAVLYHERGYHRIDAVDWSDEAWTENVVEVPESVRWFAMDDDLFLSQQAQPHSYEVIVYNFAVNADKASRVARSFLSKNGLLLAPVNDKADYWYKQSYQVLDSSARIIWKSPPEVGAWSVQFQPDVTAETCTGIWCGGVNAYRRK